MRRKGYRRGYSIQEERAAWWREEERRRARAQREIEEQKRKEERERTKREREAQKSLRIQARERDQHFQIGAAYTLTQLLSLSPKQFELKIVEILRVRGYRNVMHTGGAGDLAADIVCTSEDGQKRLVVQCKRYAPGRKVGSPEMQTFIGMMTTHHKADAGIYVTTSSFTPKAHQLGSEHRVQLVDGNVLAQWLQRTAKPVSVSPRTAPRSAPQVPHDAEYPHYNRFTPTTTGGVKPRKPEIKQYPHYNQFAPSRRTQITADLPSSISSEPGTETLEPASEISPSDEGNEAPLSPESRSDAYLIQEGHSIEATREKVAEPPHVVKTKSESPPELEHRIEASEEVIRICKVAEQEVQTHIASLELAAKSGNAVPDIIQRGFDLPFLRRELQKWHGRIRHHEGLISKYRGMIAKATEIFRSC